MQVNYPYQCALSVLERYKDKKERLRSNEKLKMLWLIGVHAEVYCLVMDGGKVELFK